MQQHIFLSYSAADAKEFAQRLYDALGADNFSVWFDKYNLVPSRDWDEQIADGIRDCRALVFAMTRDSVTANSTCKLEWTRALKYKKPIVPLLLHRDADMPFRLEPRQHIDFTRGFDAGIAKLRQYLRWLESPEGILQGLQDRRADAERDLRRAADGTELARIEDDLAQLEKQIAEQQRIVDDPAGAAKRAELSIAAGLERERQPEKPVSGLARSKFINPPPAVAPNYFQDRYEENKLVAQFLCDESKRLLLVVGRAGIGKTAMVCRLLKALESGRLPDDLGEMRVAGIVYLSARGIRNINVPNIFADLCKLLDTDTTRELDALYKNPQVSTERKIHALLGKFTQAPVILLLDNFEDAVDDAQNISDAELNDALRAVLTAPHHAVKVILTTRVAPHDLALLEPARQARIELDKGLESPFAENILREMDADGKVGLKHATDALLLRAREYTRGFPRALEALYAILSADRFTTLQEILDHKHEADNVVQALVGEAYSRLDPTAERVMQALAIFNRPVSHTAVDFLLEPYQATVNSVPILNRLVNMQFVRRDSGKYYMHPVDRAYAFGKIPSSKIKVQSSEAEIPNSDWSQHELLMRGADYFRQTRKPRDEWKKLDDLAPQLAEFDLRCEAEDYDTAASVLYEIGFEYLDLWGHYHLELQLHTILQGKLSDARQKELNLWGLAFGYQTLGELQKAISLHEEALDIARDRKSHADEGAILGNLGICYADLGQTARAIEFHEQALAIDREIGDKRGEGADLGNLGICYADLGQTARAVEFHEQALAIDREIGDRKGEGQRLHNLALALIDAGEFEKASQRAIEGLERVEEIGSPLLGNWGNYVLALAHLHKKEFKTARIAIERASNYDSPDNNHNVFALLGIIALRQGDRAAAQEAFAQAVRHADAILVNTPQYYTALDAKGLALCGLALLTERTDETIAAQKRAEVLETFRAARAVNSDAGVVKSVVRLVDQLALAIPYGDAVLAEVRRAAEGKAANGWGKRMNGWARRHPFIRSINPLSARWCWRR
ncbi:MAG: TIR domain-containing protein [Chloroflexi bacterium]|nr:TIR domain-containing protein [Chloroflexota bacterium]